MSTDSIGSNARNFANLTDWWAAIPSTLLEDEIGEVYNDSLFTISATLNLTGKTPGAFSITLRPATGQGFADAKGGAGFKLQFDQAQGAAFSSSTGYLRPMIQLANNKLTVSGLQFRTTEGNSQCVYINGAGAFAVILRDSIVSGAGTGSSDTPLWISVFPAECINCLIISTGASVTYGALVQYAATVINCTIVRSSSLSASGVGANSGGGSNRSINNTAVFNFTTCFSGTWASSSNYNAAGDATAPGANSQQSKAYADQFVSTTDNWKVKAAADLIDHGNTDATNAPNDIIGNVRGVTTAGDIGCAEYAAAAIPDTPITPGTTIAI